MSAAALPAGIAWRVVAIGVAFSLIWSSAFISGKFAVTAAPPLWTLTIRFAVAGVLMLVLLRLMGARLPAARADWLTGIGLGLLNNAVYLGLCFHAFQSVTAGMVAMIASLTPLATALIAHPALGERLSARKLAGIALGLAGAALILRSRLGGDLSLDDPVWIALVGVAMLCLSSGTVLYRARATRAHPMAMNAIMTASSAVMLLPVALALEDFGAIRWNATFFLTQAYMILVVSILGLILWFRLIREAGAGPASAFHFLNPAFALGLAFLILGEPVVASDLVGLVPIAVGILMVTGAGARRAGQAAA